MATMAEETRAGRNDPCPCGSGKKYKRCCLAQAAAVEMTWQRMRRAEGSVVEKVLAFAKARYGTGVLLHAWEEFTFGSETEPADDPLFESSFIPWFAFNWRPDVTPASDKVRLRPAPLALQCLAADADRFDEFEQRFVCAICQRPYSFYAVTAVTPGQSLALKDVMTHREYTVRERSASTMVRQGAVLYTRVLEMDGVAIMCGCAPLIIPAGERLWLLDVRHSLTRKRAPIREEQLHKYAVALRTAYFDIADRLYHPQLPTFSNTDGDPLLLQTLHFELRCSPQAAFERLRSLSLDRPARECMEDPKYDAAGALHAVRFSWLKAGNAKHKEWDNTILGTLQINGAKLTVDVNSQRRADAARSEVERRLGTDAMYRTRVMESVEKAIQERGTRPETARERRAREDNERLNALPEVQEHLRATAAAHWRNWLDEKIPALRNRTPRQASRTPEGRERLEALLQSFAVQDDAHGPTPFSADVAALRKELGLSP
jgi:hypothetical protein